MHSITTQSIECVLLGSEQDAALLQRELPVLCRRELAPAIAAALDRVAPPGADLVIERLEVDAGTMPLHGLAQGLAQAVARELEAQVRQLVAVARSASAISLQSGPAEQGTATRGHTAGAATDGRTVPARLRQAHETLDEALATFLETGRLPVAFLLAPGERLEDVILRGWEETAGSGNPAPVALRLVAALRGDTARARLSLQFSARFMHILLARVTGITAEEAQRMHEAMQAVLAAEGIAVPTEVAWTALLASAAHAGPARPRLLLDAALARLSETTSQRSPAGGFIKQRPAGQAMNQLRGSPAADENLAEAIFVDDAGLVLLHPFLPRLFEGLGIAQQGVLVAPERGLCLLRFLSGGREEAPEYELPLAKVLCGVPLARPVPLVRLAQGDREEGMAMLRAAIGHWHALRDTGVDGLRGAFLLREGKLGDRGGDWLLQVAPETLDILLDQLPWSLSPVRLPWMDRMLWVEWRQS